MRIGDYTLQIGYDDGDYEIKIEYVEEKVRSRGNLPIQNKVAAAGMLFLTAAAFYFLRRIFKGLFLIVGDFASIFFRSFCSSADSLSKSMPNWVKITFQIFAR